MRYNRLEITQKFIEKIEQTRLAKGFTQAQMAEHFGLSLSGYKKMVLGETSKIDLCHLLTLSELSEEPLWNLYGLSNEDANFFQKLHSLSPTQRRFIDGILEYEYSFQTPPLGDEEWISVIVPSSDFNDGMLWDSANLEKCNVSPYLQMYPGQVDCGLRITSNHMTPIYHAGDLLLISYNAPRNGDIGIFVDKTTGRGYIRRFRQTNPCQLLPLNGRGRVFEVDSNNSEDMDKWIKFGIVITKVRNC